MYNENRDQLYEQLIQMELDVRNGVPGALPSDLIGEFADKHKLDRTDYNDLSLGYLPNHKKWKQGDKYARPKTKERKVCDCFLNLLPENEVNLFSLANIFETNFMYATEIKNDCFFVKCNRIEMSVRLQKEEKLIKISFSQSVKSLYKFPLKVASVNVNKINKQTILVKFFATENRGTLIIEGIYRMSYLNGIIPFQLVENTKHIAEESVSCFYESFSDYILC